MRRNVRSIAVCISLLVSASHASAIQLSSTDTAQIRSGLIAGLREGNTRAFKGIPFAAPPVDSLRWRPPRPVQPWNDVRQATAFSPLCMQPPFPKGAPSPRMSEDCLTLNVWTPASSGGERLPVMVLIPGGGFFGGGSADPLWACAALAARGVVVVSLNYRVGVFGFFAHPMLSRESPNDPTGNYGLMDQIAALQWVRDNVSTFGGDAANVTIFGESAGGSSVLYLMVAPAARGLFARAISESAASIYAPLAHRTESRFGRPSAEQVGAALGADMGVLRAVPAAELLRRSATSTDVMYSDSGNVYWPFVDGTVLPDEPAALFDAGRFHRVPLILGSNTDEATLFATSLETLPLGKSPPDWKEYLGRRSLGAEALVQSTYAVATAEEIVPAGIRWVNDWYFHGSARAVARAVSQRGVPVYLYGFSHHPPVSPIRGRNMGAYHSAEVKYVFGVLRGPKDKPSPYTAADSTLARAMSGAWLQFAKSGNPNGGDLPLWPRYATSSDEHMDFGDVMTTGSELHKTALDAFDLAFAQMRAVDRKARRKKSP